MSKVIAIVNQKGGVGKSTTSGNLAFVLAKKGYDVLAIDFDSQASLTNYLNVGIREDDDYYGIHELLVKDFRPILEEEDPHLANITIEELIKETIVRPTFKDRDTVAEDGKKKVVEVEKEFGFSLIPSSLYLSDFELELNALGTTGQNGNAFRLHALIQKILAVHPYDYVIIDCNPSLGVMTINAIIAATSGIIVPTNLDLMSTRGCVSLVARVNEVVESLEKSPALGIKHMGIIGIVLNLYSERRVVDRTIQNDLNRFYPYRIFDATIPESSKAKTAVMAGLIYSQVHAKAEEAYMNLADQIIEQIAWLEANGPITDPIGSIEREDD